MRRTASGGGAGSLNARRQAVMRSGSQRLRSGAGGCGSAGRLEDRKPLELVPGARCAVDVQRAARHQAHNPERPRGAFHEQTETALPYPIVGRQQLCTRVDLPGASFAVSDLTPRRHDVTGTSCARAGAQNHACFRPSGSVKASASPVRRSRSEIPCARPGQSRPGLSSTALLHPSRLTSRME